MLFARIGIPSADGPGFGNPLSNTQGKSVNERLACWVRASDIGSARYSRANIGHLFASVFRVWLRGGNREADSFLVDGRIHHGGPGKR